MPNKNYLRGRRLEWQVKKDLEDKGWLAVRTAGSHGHWDVIAFKDDDIHDISVKLIQCKVTTHIEQIPRLVREFYKAAPLRQRLGTNISQELAVKLKGTKTYAIYTLEALNAR